MFFITLLLSLTAVTASFRSLFISTISADSIAISCPAPIAIPTSAVVRAGASFIPSPIMATFLPCSCNSLIIVALSSGISCDLTCEMPSFFCIALAVFSLSPVSITVSMPAFLKPSIASALVSFILSAMNRMPASLLSIAT